MVNIFSFSIKTIQKPINENEVNPFDFDEWILFTIFSYHSNNVGVRIECGSQ